MKKQRQWLVRVNKKFRWRLVEASDGYEALGILLKAEPDTIDTDGKGWMDNLRWGEVRLVR